MDTTCASVLSDDCSHALGKVRIPRCSQTNTAKRCGGAIVADAKGTIGHFQRGQANVLDLANVEIVDAADEVDFLLERELLEQRVRAGFNGRSGEGGRLCPGKGRDEKKDDDQLQLSYHGRPQQEL